MSSDSDLCAKCLHERSEHANGPCTDVGETETPDSQPTECLCSGFAGEEEDIKSSESRQHFIDTGRHLVKTEQAPESTDLTALTDAARNLDSTVTAYMLGEAGGGEVAQAQARVRRIVHRVLTTPVDAAPATEETA